MNPSNVFQLEIAMALAGRRTFAMRVGLAFALGLPFALLSIPLRAKAAGLVVLAVFISFFGTAVAAVRRRESGQSARLRLLPLPRWLVAADHVLSDSVIDVLQITPVLALFAVVNGRQTGAPGVVCALGILLVTIVTMNVLGAALAAVMKSNPEVHLFAALGVGIIAFVSGLVPTPARARALVNAASGFSPPAWLARALEDLGSAEPGGAGAGWPAAAVVLAAFAAAVVLRASDRGPSRRVERKRADDPPADDT